VPKTLALQTTCCIAHGCTSPAHSSDSDEKMVCYHPSLSWPPLSLRVNHAQTGQTTLWTAVCSSKTSLTHLPKAPYSFHTISFLRAHESRHMTEIWRDRGQGAMGTGGNSSPTSQLTCSQFHERKPLGTRCALEYLYRLHIAYFSFTSLTPF